MYLTTVARSLGDAPVSKHYPLPPVYKHYPLPPLPKPRLSGLGNPPVSKHYPLPPVSKHYPLPPLPKPRLSGLGTTPACADAGTGLLIDCWRAAEQKGLGYSLDQAQLAKVATAYQRLTRPNSLAGWVFTGKKMVWRGGPLGDAILPTDYSDPTGGGGGDSGGWVVPPSYVTPPDPLAIAQQQRSPLPPIVYQSQPVLPLVTAQTLFAAAQLPNAPAIVKQAAAQLPASNAGVSGLNMGWFTQQMISGIPNWGLVAGGFVLLMLVAKKRR